jgi:ATP-dependent DNA helicase UvrD/PcrA
MGTTTWSAQQKAIFRWFAKGIGNLVVRARAGTGKTTTIIEAITYARELRILLCAFNKRIQEELAKRITNPNAKAQTLHSIGFALVRLYWERVRVCERNERADALTEAVCGNQVPYKVKRLVTKLHTKAREIAPHATNPGELLDLAFMFECDPDDQWAQQGFDVHYVERMALKAMQRAAERNPIDTGIDFADMIFLPVRNRWLRPMFDLVVVDEAQDMTPAQLEIAMGICAPGGRIVLVGDDRQAIYGFRGADSDSLDRLKAELNATELGLTTTYRCGKVIVELAQRLVPDFQAAPTNPAGDVVDLSADKVTALAMGGDFILSRINAPLASMAMALLRLQKPVRIAGKEIGAGLVDVIRRLAEPSHSIELFLEKLTAWEIEAVNRAMKANRPERCDDIHDKVETLSVLSEGVPTVAALQQRIDALFSDRVASDMTTCSSVHKAKGLEADRVFVLWDTLYPTPRPPANGKKRAVSKTVLEQRQREEQNIEYVAITRAKQTLFRVSSLGGTPPAPDPAFTAVAAIAAPLPAAQERVVDASTLGLTPGEWPPRLSADGRWYRISHDTRVRGELQSTTYIVEGGIDRLVVLND